MPRFAHAALALAAGSLLATTPALADRTTPKVRDHRTDHGSKPTVRDHRSEPPKVRDHRSKPTVRDHRSQSASSLYVPAPAVRDHRSEQQVHVDDVRPHLTRRYARTRFPLVM